MKTINKTTVLLLTVVIIVLMMLSTLTIIKAQTTWTGTVSTAWDNALNWSGGIPGAGTDAVIPVVGTYPNIVVAGTCKSMSVNAGATLNMGVGGSLTVSGSWTNDGTFNGGSQTVTLNATGNINGASTTTFYNLTISGGGTRTMGVNAIVSNTLTLTSGNIDMGTYTLTLGISSASKGNLSRTSGTLYNGTFKRWFIVMAIADGNANGLFPVGTSANYRPVYVAPTVAPTTAGTISVAYTDASTTSDVSFADGASTVAKRHDAYWSMSTAGGLAGGTYDLRAEGTGFGTIGNVNDMRITLLGSVIGSAGSNAGTTANPIIRRTGLAIGNLSNSFYAGSVDAVSSPLSTPLPITLVSFNAQDNGEMVNLTWATGSETNNQLFTIERSSDATSFSPILRVSGAGNSTTLINYTAMDDKPLQGTAYYRLKQTDFNGQTSYSSVIEINRRMAGEFTVFPNPSNGQDVQVTLPYGSDDGVLVVVRDLTGREAFSKVMPLSQNNNFIIARDLLGQLTAGVYIINASSENKDYSKKLVVR